MLPHLHHHPELSGVTLTGLCEHTAEVKAGYGFIGVAPSLEVLQAHCLAAAQAGARALIVDAPDIDTDLFCVPCVQVPGIAEKRAQLAAEFYDFPSKKLLCVGVTGTNGKTSVAHHIADLSSRLGRPMGYSGTLGWGHLDALDQPSDLSMTTANAVALQRQMADMVNAGLHGVALEVSSHALSQGRVAQIHFDYAVFTNLTRDHLDYHGSLEAYGQAKQTLFMWPGLQGVIINAGDPFGQALIKSVKAPVTTYGGEGQWSWCSGTDDVGLNVSWRTPEGEFETRLSSMADFVVANLTAAMAVLVASGFPVKAVIEQVDRVRNVPGRLERIGVSIKQPKVVVDYAHTPDALAKVLSGLRSFCQGRLFCVVGCGGDRDRGKRPQMGAVAAAGADRVWLTSDNPRSEAPEAIIRQMLAGADAVGTKNPTCAEMTVQVDRAAAIRAALCAAEPIDVVLVAGKGHETFQEIGAHRLPFDDRLVAQQVLEELI
ncbi:MAG: UDP-N-acetylmuramoyl-L-alanyl-D-glutamate--2,6-diaminopimelate ligase [Gammaproteobacteria bacterium]|nr:UDP-N-acetylmuramoyl-L-alanyl-D-glutamate--2,6-diaminopimelate ligase [Gammaproteobacteria bacterium]